MDEINSGSHADSADLSKTFDQDETFDKVPHLCSQGPTGQMQMLKPGARCTYCGAEVLKQPR